jgi:hypothetical protein
LDKNETKVDMRFTGGRLLGLIFALLAELCHGADGAAVGGTDDSFALKGFGTLGLARSDSDTAEYVRDLSQPHGLSRHWSSSVDSVLGLQGNWRLGSSTEGVVQIISRYRYDGSNGPELSWAFLRHDFSPDFQMRVGRLGTEFYMFADSRLIGYSNVTVRPPPDFYGPLIFSSLDGVDATANLALGQGLLRAKLFAGRSPETSPFVESVTWRLRGSRLIGGHLDYLSGPWQFRAGHSEVRFSDNELPLREMLAPLFAPGLAPDIVALYPELSMVNTTSRFDSVGIVFDRGPLQVRSMAGRIRHESESYEDSRAAFVVGSYRLGSFTPYLGYSRAKTSATRLTTSVARSLDGIAHALSAASHLDQHTVTVGTRWDFHRSWAMKVQFDRISGRPESILAFRGPSPQWDGHMKVLSATLDFAF